METNERTYVYVWKCVEHYVTKDEFEGLKQGYLNPHDMFD